MVKHDSDSLNEKTAQLHKLQEVEGPQNTVKIKELQKEIGEMLDKEDLKWRRGAKRTWYIFGDRNTKYFHVCTSQRKKKN